MPYHSNFQFVFYTLCNFLLREDTYIGTHYFVVKTLNKSYHCYISYKRLEMLKHLQTFKLLSLQCLCYEENERNHNINRKRIGMKIQNDHGNVVALYVYVHASMPSIMNAMLLRLYITCFTHI